MNEAVIIINFLSWGLRNQENECGKCSLFLFLALSDVGKHKGFQKQSCFVLFIIFGSISA